MKFTSPDPQTVEREPFILDYVEWVEHKVEHEPYQDDNGETIHPEPTVERRAERREREFRIRQDVTASVLVRVELARTSAEVLAFLEDVIAPEQSAEWRILVAATENHIHYQTLKSIAQWAYEAYTEDPTQPS